MKAPWALEIEVSEQALAPVEEALAPLGLATSWFETKSGWRLQVLMPRPPGLEELKHALALARAAAGMALPEAVVYRVADRDWVSHSNRLRQPLRLARFYLYERAHAAARPRHLYPILLEAGRAFGTGRAPSTQGCLLAISAIARERAVTSALDLGTGSGVLAIALARANRRASVLAVDHDPVAVGVAAANIAANGLTRRVRALQAEGCRHRAIRAQAPFALIVANILADPLRRMARTLSGLAEQGGTVVLSGILSREERSVLWVYRAAGFCLWRRFELAGWVTLALRREPG